jgi:hypothetical protein
MMALCIFIIIYLSVPWKFIKLSTVPSSKKGWKSLLYTGFLTAYRRTETAKDRISFRSKAKALPGKAFRSRGPG